MVKLSALFVGFLCYLPLSALAAGPAITEIAYPKGKSFPEVAQQMVLPYFEEETRTSLVFGNVQLALHDKFAERRKQFYQQVMKFDKAHYQAWLRGATMNFKTSELTLADGRTVPISGSSNDALAISLASHDVGAGLFLDFPPLAYRAYFAPMTRINLRVYTRAPDGRYFDKRYDDICAELQTIPNPEFYFILVDAAIRGEFDLVARLPAKQQELIVDMISVAIAEHRLQYKTGNPRNVHLMSRTGPFYNLAIDSLLFNHGAWQWDADGRVMRGDCNYYLYWYVQRENANVRNSLHIARILSQAEPLAFGSLSATMKPNRAVSLHEIIAYFMEYPAQYDIAMRLHLRTLMLALPKQVPRINQAYSTQ